MKNLINAILGIGLMLLAACGEDRAVIQNTAAAPKASPLAPMETKVDNKGFPEALVINASVKTSEVVPIGNSVFLDLDLDNVLYEIEKFDEPLDLKNAKSVTFGSVHKKCKLDRGFGQIANGGSADYQLRGFSGTCTQVFLNIRRFKNMHIRFENVPLVSDKNKVIPFVELRLAPKA